MGIPKLFRVLSAGARKNEPRGCEHGREQRLVSHQPTKWERFNRNPIVPALMSALWVNSPCAPFFGPENKSY